MPLDAVCLRGVVQELKPLLIGQRIDKVQMPTRDQAVLTLRAGRLLLNAGAGAPRLQMTALARENPAEPPMFCMLLRKHLVGARVADITQPPLERLVRLELDSADDFGRRFACRNLFKGAVQPPLEDIRGHRGTDRPGKKRAVVPR